MSTWNKKNFSIYTSDERSALGLIEELGDQTNYNTQEIENVKESDNKKVSHDEMHDNYKIDNQGNFTGSWFGFEHPMETEEGLKVQVVRNEKSIKNLNNEILNKTNELETNLRVQATRIDNLTTQGNNVDNAETADIRISRNGTVFNSAGQSVREQFKEINDYLETRQTLGNNIIDTNHLLTLPMSSFFTKNDDGAYYSEIIPISGLANIGNGVGLKCVIELSNAGENYNNIKNINIQYLNKLKKVITYYQVGNGVNSNYPVTDAKFIRIMTNETKYNEIQNLTLKSFALGFNITKAEPYSLIQKGKFDDLYNFVGDAKMLPINYNNIIRSINRIGYDVYNSLTPPQQSILSYKMAYEKGFRILLCDLRFTSDNIPVLHHDDIINSYAKNSDGTPLSEEISISLNTYSKLLEYDYGIYKGEQYKGTKIMHLKEMLYLCKMLGCELYIEVKAMNKQQAKIACDLVKKYGMDKVTSWSGTFQQMQFVIENDKYARVSTMPQIITDTHINELKSLKTGFNKVFVFAWDTTVLDETLVNKLIENEINFEMGTLNSEEKIINYFLKDENYNYCTGISSDKIVSGKVLLNNMY